MSQFWRKLYYKYWRNVIYVDTLQNMYWLSWLWETSLGRPFTRGCGFWGWSRAEHYIRQVSKTSFQRVSMVSHHFCVVWLNGCKNILCPAFYFYDFLVCRSRGREGGIIIFFYMCVNETLFCVLYYMFILLFYKCWGSWLPFSCCVFDTWVFSL